MIPNWIDLFILDVEGAEISILSTFPWKQIRGQKLANRDEQVGQKKPDGNHANEKL